MADSINNKIVSGVSWSAFETLSFYLVKFVIGIILARLLMPADFGILGILMVFVSISDIFVDAGLGQAYIHKKEVSNVDADTVFIANFSISLFIYVLLFFLAPFLAAFYEYPLLTWLIRLISIGIIIDSFNVIQNAIVRREFLFRKRAIIHFLSAILSGLIGIACAIHNLGVWSLVIQQIVQKILICLMLYAALNWRLTFSFSWEVAKEMIGYGAWIFISNIVSRIFTNVYKISIGKLFPVSELGYYERARQFNSLVSDTFTGMIGKVAFPAYSRVQDNKSELKLMTGRFVKYTAMLIMPLIAILYVVSEPLILLLLTEKWMQAVKYLQLMCLAGFLIPFYYFIGPLLQATNNLKLVFINTVFLGLLRVLNVVILFRYGVFAIIIGEVVCLFIFIVLSSFMVKKLLGFNYLGSIYPIWRIIAYVCVIIVIGTLISNAIYSFNPLWRVFLPAVLMFAAYITMIIIFDRSNIIGLYHHFVKI